VVPVLLEDMWYQHDGAPPHYGRRVRYSIDEEFHGRWICRGGPIHWPPQSPDLNPIDFFLWGHLMENVYLVPPSDQRTQ
jgi:hypothetical protein